jgi:hypothetical protein
MTHSRYRRGHLESGRLSGSDDVMWRLGRFSEIEIGAGRDYGFISAAYKDRMNISIFVEGNLHVKCDRTEQGLCSGKVA